MENPGECSVCFTTYNESERRPRNLPCGHTFCSPCISNMMEGGQLSCPTCRAHHPATSAAQFPISYGIEAFVKQLEVMKLTQISTAREVPEGKLPQTKAGVVIYPASVSTEATCQKQSTGISRKLQSLLEEQRSSMNTVMAGSQEVQSQLDQYREQLADWKIQHLHLLDRLYDLVQQHKSALELLEQEDTRVLGMKTEGEKGEKQLEAVLGSLQAVKTAQEIFTTIDHADHCTVETEDWMQKCQELFPDVNTITSNMKVREVTKTVLDIMVPEAGDAEGTFHLVDPTLSIIEKLKMITLPKEILKVEDLRSMRPLVKRLVEAGRVYGILEDQGGLRSSRIILENGKMYLHCFQDQPPPPHVPTLPVSDMVGALDPSSTLVFMDLCWPGSTRGRIHIRLSPDTSRARQFVLLCTGQRSHSYLNTVLLRVCNKGEPGERVVGGDYENNNGEGGTSLLPHPYHQYRKSGRAGAVMAWYWLGSEKSAQFTITTRDLEEGRKSNNVIGEVESGLEVVRAAVNHSDITQVTVVDCGVVGSL